MKKAAIVIMLISAILFSTLVLCRAWGADVYTFSVSVGLGAAPPPPEIVWEKEYGTEADGKYREWSWIGGPGYTKPAFCDIDNDGDYDMFIGKKNGGVYFYRNDGAPTSPTWTLMDKKYNYIEGMCASPAFCDIDGDGDYDMFVGEKDGNVNFYRNDGAPAAPSWAFVTQNYNSGAASCAWSAPSFCDIDGDGDYDMFMGEEDGGICFYRNDGAPTSPSWTFVTEDYDSIDVEYSSAPSFCDIDGDGDYDMFIGEREGNINFYLNNGTPNSPSWVLITENYEDIDVGEDSAPAFCDIDGDGDYDMFIGSKDGGIDFRRNITPVGVLPNVYVNCPEPVSAKKVEVDISSDDDRYFISPILYVDDKFIGRKERLPCSIKWNNTEKFTNGPHVLHVHVYYLPLHRWIVIEQIVQLENPAKNF